MRITRISPQASNPNRANVYADGLFYAGVDQTVAYRLNLKPGMEITPELEMELAGQDQFARGWDFALRCLRIAPQSELRLREKLIRRIDNIDLVDQIMERLKEADLVNDRRLAEAIVTKYTELLTKSPREISLILIRKGIPKEITSSLTSALRTLDSTAAIEKLATSKLRSLKGVETRLQYEKVAAYLGRKGFKYSEVKAVLDSLLTSREL